VKVKVNIVYAYPIWHTVSFTLIARKHIKYMREKWKVDVHEVDELSFPTFTPVSNPVAFAHPAIFIMNRVIESRRDVWGRFRREYFDWWKSHFKCLVGIDVCDSDRMSELAVYILNLYDKVVTHSTFCVEVYRRSGVKPPVYRVPHGVDPEWYEMPNVWESLPATSINPAVLQLYLYKLRRRKKVILFWLWHSAERKGWPEVREVYRRLATERDDVVLVLKTGIPNPIEYQQVMDLGAINIYGWLSETDKIALYDISDIVLNFSRGGGFEHTCLEALARGVPCVSSDYGSWTDYVPKFLQVRRGRKVQPLPGNKIHVGYGYTVDVDSAVDKIHDILDNLQEYKAKVLEWREKVLRKEYRWDRIARKLIEIAKE